MHFLRKSTLCACIATLSTSLIEARTPSNQPAKRVRAVVEMTQEQAFITMLESGNSAGIEELVQSGDFDVNEAFENGATPLSIAILGISLVGNDSLTVIKILLDNGANPDGETIIAEQQFTPQNLINALLGEVAAYKTANPEIAPEQSATLDQISALFRDAQKLIDQYRAV